MNVKILCLYPNMTDLYGDNSNIDILRYRANKRNIDVSVDVYTIGDDAPNLNNYDLVFLGGSSSKEQKIVTKELLKIKKEIKDSIKKGVFYLLICSGFEIFGKSFEDNEKNKVKALGIYNFYTEHDKNKRCIGDIVLQSDIDDEKINILGFENHISSVKGIDKPLGKVIYGNGNSFKNEYEGYLDKNVIGTHLHGPLLSKNPELADYILTYILERKYKKNIELEKINDEFEYIAKKEMLDKLLNGRI